MFEKKMDGVPKMKLSVSTETGITASLLFNNLLTVYQCRDTFDIHIDHHKILGDKGSHILNKHHGSKTLKGMTTPK